jgi:hypothetical protein
VTNFRTVAATLAVGFVVAAAASPSVAASTKRAVHPGHAARAQAGGAGAARARGAGDGSMTSQREQALRECSERANKLVQRDWGVMQNTTMNACMTEHGQMP